MNADAIALQQSCALDLAACIGDDHKDAPTELDLLDYLAIVGLKLVPLGPDDYDAEGVSLASWAYFNRLLGVTP